MTQGKGNPFDPDMQIEATFLTIVNCSMLNSPMNGMINCSLGDDGVPSYKDTCGFTCNTGYELTGSTERTCQSNGNWSINSRDAMCGRGMTS